MKSNKKLLKDIHEGLSTMSTHAVLRSALIAKKLGINTTDLECLEILLNNGTMSAGELGARARLTTGAVTKMIDRLENIGFLERDFQKLDRRKVFVKLNMETVKAKVFPLYASIAENMEESLSKFSLNELELISNFIQLSIGVSQADLDKLGMKSS
jgi:DNA-binding MarR family transcriptional regulator